MNNEIEDEPLGVVWNTMETAPKDGHTVLLKMKSGRLTLRFWRWFMPSMQLGGWVSEAERRNYMVNGFDTDESFSSWSPVSGLLVGDVLRIGNRNKKRDQDAWKSVAKTDPTVLISLLDAKIKDGAPVKIKDIEAIQIRDALFELVSACARAPNNLVFLANIGNQT